MAVRYRTRFNPSKGTKTTSQNSDIFAAGVLFKGQHSISIHLLPPSTKINIFGATTL